MTVADDYAREMACLMWIEPEIAEANNNDETIESQIFAFVIFRANGLYYKLPALINVKYI